MKRVSYGIFRAAGFYTSSNRRFQYAEVGVEAKVYEKYVHRWPERFVNVNLEQCAFKIVRTYNLPDHKYDDKAIIMRLGWRED